VTRREFPHLTALRGIAVLAVITFHVASLTGAVNRSFTGRLAALLGSVGPIVFFVLSGFLLLRPFIAGEPSLRRYARRRCLRILPPYWTALTLLALFPGVVGVFSGDWWRFYGLVQNTSAQTFGQGIPVAWTLCVEMTFYALLPVWALLTRRASLRTHALVFGAAFAVGVLVQALAARLTVDQLVADALPGQIAWFALGGGLAVWSIARPALRVPAPAAWGVAAAALLLMAVTVQGRTLAEIVAALGEKRPLWPVLRQIGLTAVLCVGLLMPAIWGEGGAVRGFLACRPVAYLGLISYSLFLYHLTVAELLANDADPGHFDAGGLGLDVSTPVLLVLTLAVSGAVASVSYWVVERPFMSRPGLRR
jgi:peptidoglycan/LPS O-acetylase OafA/YrhL